MVIFKFCSNSSSDFRQSGINSLAGFSSKRKQLWHNLVSGLQVSPEQAKQCLQEVTGNTKIRAQELSITEWKQLVVCLGE